MKILFNEQMREIVEGTTLLELIKVPNLKDYIIVHNAFPFDIEQGDIILKEKDTITLIQKGIMPSKEELEALMHARHTPYIYKKLKATTIGIAGLGGLGSTIAIALARVGIGKLILVDFDIVEPSNLNRQQYFVEHI